MMDLKCYRMMKEAGLDVSEFASFFEPNEIDQFKLLNSMKTEKEHNELNDFAAAIVGKGKEIANPRDFLAFGEPETKYENNIIGLAPNGNVIKFGEQEYLNNVFGPQSNHEFAPSSFSNDPALIAGIPAPECPSNDIIVIDMNAVQMGATAKVVGARMEKKEGYTEEDVQAYKERLTIAIRNREAGISRNPPHHIVLFSEEPDAIPIPYSSVLHGAKNIELKQIDENTPQPTKLKYFNKEGVKRSSLYKGSNYTPPKKKRKKR
jgi:hypothetical protein